MVTALLVALALDAGAKDARPRWLPPPGQGAATSAVYHLRPDRDGFVYEGSAFRARVAPDGAVKFEDTRFRPKLALPLPSPHPAGTPTLEGTLRRKLGRRPPPVTEDRPPPVPDRSVLQEELCDYRSPCFFPLIEQYPEQSTQAKINQLLRVRVAGPIDLTEMAMGLFGAGDPYRHEKARFMSATFDFRARLAGRARARRARAALDALPAQLDQVWADRRAPAIERRRVICALWAGLDGRDAAPARTLVEEYVRRVLPAGSHDAYPPGELDACTALAGRPFAPYAP